MGSFGKAALGLAVGLAAVATASDVHDLKADSFAPFINDNKLVLAEFFAPWSAVEECAHCCQLTDLSPGAVTAKH